MYFEALPLPRPEETQPQQVEGEEIWRFLVDLKDLNRRCQEILIGSAENGPTFDDRAELYQAILQSTQFKGIFLGEPLAFAVTVLNSLPDGR